MTPVEDEKTSLDIKNRNLPNLSTHLEKLNSSLSNARNDLTAVEERLEETAVFFERIRLNARMRSNLKNISLLEVDLKKVREKTLVNVIAELAAVEDIPM